MQECLSLSFPDCKPRLLQYMAQKIISAYDNTFFVPFCKPFPETPSRTPSLNQHVLQIILKLTRKRPELNPEFRTHIFPGGRADSRSDEMDIHFCLIDIYGKLFPIKVPIEMITAFIIDRNEYFWDICDVIVSQPTVDWCPGAPIRLMEGFLLSSPWYF